MKPHRTTTLLSLLALAAAPPAALAQDAPEEGAEGEQGAQQPGVTVITVPTPAPQQQVVTPSFDPNSHLPSSSRGTLDTARSGDGFDLAPRTQAQPSVRGNANGAFVTEGQYLPEAHSVRRGDTLWDISGRYYQNPYAWPQLWAMNPQLQNPHWIYPGDNLRLRTPEDSPGSRANLMGADGLKTAGKRVPPQTVFLRTVGWVDDPDKDTWGHLVGSPEDQMLLSEGDDVYLKLSKKKDDQEGEEIPIAIGQELTIFQPIVTSSSKASGGIVSVRGTVRVDRYNPKTRMVRARIIESLDTIERGARIGDVVRRFDVVPPRQSNKDIEARILASIYPHHLYGQHQVVFLDKGKEDGVEPGMRFFAVRRGDRWVQTLPGAGQMATVRPRVEDDRAAQVDKMTYGVDEDLLPDETYAELRVMSVRDHTAAAIVTASMHEIERTAVLVARKGY